MIEAILLYGSKARGDHDRFSDTDLLGISTKGPILKPFDDFGMSFHIYPKAWLTEQAEAGSLFLLHLVNEAKVVHDPSNSFQRVTSHFSYKDSYSEQILLGNQVVAAILSLPESRFTDKLRRRYFWGLRTALMAESAHLRSPAFSACALESLSKIDGLALHIQTRSDASFAECRRMGRMVLEHTSQYIEGFEIGNHSEVLDRLVSSGGIGAVVAGELDYV
jgi:hypothetical protein